MVARSAAAKATAAADALLAWLRDQYGPAAPLREAGAAAGHPEEDAIESSARGDVPSPNAPCPQDGDPAALRSRSTAPAVPGVARSDAHVSADTASGAMCPPHTDWLHHRLAITGPVGQLAAFRAAAAGAGIIPWQFDCDRLEEDFFHTLVSPPGLSGPPARPGSLILPGSPTLQQRGVSVAGARVLAGQLREAVARRHEMAALRVGRSQACPFDLHALVPVPDAVLRLGPADPAALAWLWEHWGTTQALRHVAEDGGSGRPRRRRTGEGAGEASAASPGEERGGGRTGFPGSASEEAAGGHRQLVWPYSRGCVWQRRARWRLRHDCDAGDLGPIACVVATTAKQVDDAMRGAVGRAPTAAHGGGLLFTPAKR